jgi:hypothetical protein
MLSEGLVKAAFIQKTFEVWTGIDSVSRRRRVSLRP